MQCLEVSGAVRPIYGSLGVKRLRICSALPYHGPDPMSLCPEWRYHLCVNEYNFKKRAIFLT